LVGVPASSNVLDLLGRTCTHFYSLTDDPPDGLKAGDGRVELRPLRLGERFPRLVRARARARVRARRRITWTPPTVRR